MVSVARQDAKGTLIDGKRIMDSILQAHPEVKGIICGNGPVALGAIAALKAANRSDVVVVGIDGSNDERDAAKAGTLNRQPSCSRLRLSQHKGLPIWITTCKKA